MACSKSPITNVSALLRCKADPHIKNIQKRTALHFAASNKDVKVVALLLEHMDNPMKRQRQRDAAGFTPFELACSLGNGPVAKYLFDRYPRALLGKTAKCDKLKRTLLHLLLTSFPTEVQRPVLNYLLQLVIDARPEDIWARDADGSTPLAVHVAQHYRNDNMTTFAAVLTKLSHQEVDKAIYCMFSTSTLPQSLQWNPGKWLVLQRMMTSAKHAKYVPCVLQYVSKEALVASDDSGRSILHWLAIFGAQPSLIQAVKEFKTDRDEERKTAPDIDTGVELPILSVAAHWLSTVCDLSWMSLLKREPMKAILDEMTSKSEKSSSQPLLRVFDNRQDTPMHIAAKYNNVPAIKHLWELFGEEVKGWKDAEGKTALHVAAEFDAARALIEMRKTCSWNLEEVDKAGYTPYMRALKAQKLASAAVLVALGAASSGVVASDGTSIEALVEAHNIYASEVEARREARRLKREAELNSEEEDWSSTERHSDASDGEVEEAETGSTGSVEIKSDPGSPGSNDEETDSVGTKPFFRPTIKPDSEYDEDLVVKGGGTNGITRNGHGKVRFSGKGALRPWMQGGSARIAKDDEYDKSDSDPEEDGESDHSFEEKSSGSEPSPVSSPGASPRLEHTPARVESPPPPMPSLLSPRSSPSSSPRQPFSPTHSTDANVLRRQVEDMNLTLSSYQSQLSISQEQILELERTLKARELEYADLVSQLRDKDDLLATQHQEISGLLKSSKSGSSEAEKWQEQVKSLQASNTELSDSQSQLSEKLSESNALLLLRSSENEALKTQVESLASDLSQAKSAVNNLQSSVQAAHLTITNLQNSLDEAQSKRNDNSLSEVVLPDAIPSSRQNSLVISRPSQSTISTGGRPPVKKAFDWSAWLLIIFFVVAAGLLLLVLSEDSGYDQTWPHMRPGIYYT
jgi:ankyrin repeat protein